MAGISRSIHARSAPFDPSEFLVDAGNGLREPLFPAGSSAHSVHPRGNFIYYVRDGSAYVHEIHPLGIDAATGKILVRRSQPVHRTEEEAGLVAWGSPTSYVLYRRSVERAKGRAFFYGGPGAQTADESVESLEEVRWFPAGWVAIRSGGQQRAGASILFAAPGAAVPRFETNEHVHRRGCTVNYPRNPSEPFESAIVLSDDGAFVPVYRAHLNTGDSIVYRAGDREIRLGRRSEIASVRRARARTPLPGPLAERPRRSGTRATTLAAAASSSRCTTASATARCLSEPPRPRRTQTVAPCGPRSSPVFHFRPETPFCA